MGCRLIDRTGKRFSRLVAVQFLGSWDTSSRWECRCDCGAVVIVTGPNLGSGHTKSCGCLNAERIKTTSLTHGATARGCRSPEFRTWIAMRERCANPHNASFKNYGGRGIHVCAEWLNDFRAFFETVGVKPSPSHSIDRYPNPDGNYEPGNVRWATRSQQAENRSPRPRDENNRNWLPGPL
jgi:hypothetical protein